MRRIPFAAMFFITFIIITGVIISIDISLIETEAISDNPDLKQIKEKDDGKINYQQMYKQYDFAKYLNHYYTYIKEDSNNYQSPDGVENSKVNSFSITSNNLNDKDGDNKKQHKQSNRHNDDSKVTKILELDRKNMVEDNTDSSDKKRDKQTYKNVKIIECRNFNINAYELDDLQSVETLLSNPSTLENDDEVTQQEKGHSSENSKEAREYNIGSNTKVIFICNNERYNLSPLNSNNFGDSLSSDGIIVPTSVSKNNYDDASDDEN